MRFFANSRGYTLAELLISLFITGLLATAGFQFYIKMHNSTLTQEQVSEMQQSSRASMQEMSRVLRMAGYKLAAHVPYRINGDSLYVFYRDAAAIDTVLYFLQNYTEYEVVLPDSLDQSLRPKKLMKQVNSQFAQVFADNINDMSFAVVNPSTIEITLTVQPLKADEDLHTNSGFRTYTAVERVKLRNLGI
jgi:prepilin-type N-terminal cleavage/methylation domain-containing protein